jgi:hypothetical protein
MSAENEPLAVRRVDDRSVLLVTLDSCRFDTFADADAPNMKSISPLYCARAPANFTFGSHASIFAGFTPGVPTLTEPYVNPKWARIFKVGEQAFPGKSSAWFSLSGRSIIDGFRRQGYRTVGAASMSWLDPANEIGQLLTQDFDEFFFASRTGLAPQLAWALPHIAGAQVPVFAFLNIGETHVPYWHEGAAWDFARNPCQPFADDNDAADCRMRQRACVEFVDRLLSPLLDMFAGATTVVCADHGDCWGEDGLWGHGFTHEKVMEVPLLFRLGVRQPAA